MRKKIKADGRVKEVCITIEYPKCKKEEAKISGEVSFIIYNPGKPHAYFTTKVDIPDDLLDEIYVATENVLTIKTIQAMIKDN